MCQCKYTNRKNSALWLMYLHCAGFDLLYYYLQGLCFVLLFTLAEICDDTGTGTYRDIRMAYNRLWS